MAPGTKLNGTLRDFIEQQQVFFVATAAETGRVNLSPKGADSLRILDDNRLIWINLSGSGNETAGHIKQTNRMTLMFCAFEGPARILRLYGTAKVTHPRHDAWDELAAHFPKLAGSRQIFDLAIDMVHVSCGSGVPYMDYKSDRSAEEMLPFFDKMDDDGMEAFWRKKNTLTVDGFETGLFED